VVYLTTVGNHAITVIIAGITGIDGAGAAAATHAVNMGKVVAVCAAGTAMQHIGVCIGFTAVAGNGVTIIIRRYTVVNHAHGTVAVSILGIAQAVTVAVAGTAVGSGVGCVGFAAVINIGVTVSIVAVAGVNHAASGSAVGSLDIIQRTAIVGAAAAVSIVVIGVCLATGGGQTIAISPVGVTGINDA